jgi:hypothetical protein
MQGISIPGHESGIQVGPRAESNLEASNMGTLNGLSVGFILPECFRTSFDRTRTQTWKTSVLSTQRCFSYISCRPPWLLKIPIPTNFMTFVTTFLNTAFKFDGWFTIYSRVCPMNPVFSLACSYFLRFHHGYQLMNIREVIHFCWNFHGHGFCVL